MKSLAVLNECSFSESQIKLLQSKFSDAVFYTDTSSESQATKRIGQRNIIIMDQFMFTFSEELLKKCTGLELVVVNTTAYDAIDTELLEKYHIKFANLDEYATQDVAETALSMALSLNNRTQTAQELVIKEGVTDLYPGNKFIPTILRSSLVNQTVGIIGLGKIGQRCAKLFSSLGAKVIGYNRTNKVIQGIRLFPLKTLCKQADIIIICLSYTPGENDEIIDRELLSIMKNKSILISISHPNLIDIDYLIEINQKFAGIGLDYLVTNKVIKLVESRHRNLILTPHLGSQSYQSVKNMTELLIKNVLNFAYD